jgi:hypothetical protein
MTTAILDDSMTRRDAMPVRPGTEAVDVAKRAAAVKGTTPMDYATAVLLEAANRDLDAYARAWVKASTKTKPKPPTEPE